MKTQMIILRLFVLFTFSQALANLGPQFPPMTGQGMGGQMIAPNQGVALDPGAYQSQYYGQGDIPAWAINQNHLCNGGRFDTTNNFNFGAQGQQPGRPGIHQ